MSVDIDSKTVQLAHGGGGALMQALIAERFAKSRGSGTAAELTVVATND